MKGYSKAAITEEEIIGIKNLVNTAIEYCESFLVKKEVVGSWIFKRMKYTYRTDQPPLGVYMIDLFDTPSVGTTSWIDNLSDILQLHQAGNEVYLDEKLSLTLNNFRAGKYSSDEKELQK